MQQAEEAARPGPSALRHAPPRFARCPPGGVPALRPLQGAHICGHVRKEHRRASLDPPPPAPKQQAWRAPEPAP